MASLVNEVKLMSIRKEAGSERKSAVDAGFPRLEAVYRGHVAHIHTLCMRLLADAHDAEEATAQVFVRLGHELTRWWGESRVLTRLRALAVNESLRRMWARRAESPEVQAPKIFPSPSPFAEPLTGHPGRVPATTTAPIDSKTLNQNLRHS